MEDSYLQKLLLYDYNKTQAYQKMSSLATSLMQKNPNLIQKQNQLQVFKRQVQEEVRKKNEKFLENFEEDGIKKNLDETKIKIKNMKNEIEREKQRKIYLLEKQKLKSIEILNRELEFYQIMFHLEKKVKQNSLIKNSKEMENLQEYKRDIERHLRDVK